MNPPPVVATVGLHGSASTWVFNIVRELMIAAFGADRVLAAYADKPADVPDEALGADKFLVLKSHQGSEELDAWLAAQSAPIVLSVRDPRDACLSMVQRFNARLGHAVHWLARDCNRLARLAARAHLLLRYEDRFFDQPAAVTQLAGVISLNPNPADIMPLFTRYQTESVRAFARSMEDLPPARIVAASHSVVDRVTQIHGTHIGDTRSGKWRDLPAPVQAELTRVFSPFLDSFGYPR
jgi:hypothetical protein